MSFEDSKKPKKRNVEKSDRNTFSCVMYSGDYASKLKSEVEVVKLARDLKRVESDLRRDDVSGASRTLNRVLKLLADEVDENRDETLAGLLWEVLRMVRSELFLCADKSYSTTTTASRDRNELRRRLLLVATGIVAMSTDSKSSPDKIVKDEREILSDLIMWSFQRLEDKDHNMSMKGTISDFILALTMSSSTNEMTCDALCDQNAWRRIMTIIIDSFSTVNTDDDDDDDTKTASDFTKIDLNRAEHENTLVSLACVAGRACKDLTHGTVVCRIFGKSATGMLRAFLSQSDVEQRCDVWSIRGVLQYTKNRRTKNRRRDSDKDADDLSVCLLRFGSERKWHGFCECHEDEDGL